MDETQRFAYGLKFENAALAYQAAIDELSVTQYPWANESPMITIPPSRGVSVALEFLMPNESL